ncbi:hypothetical protein B0T20DRAFT_359616 [Sordaria brevicollis]|uniref:GCN5-related N-acetyltransferase Rv2170-like domain-containing protein n=1 Tax=Sordaria brevicollis TaxID=83679 RepID=A0AAE0U9Y1_SORBR|nr:hypothetical protein B0T20DRAFT_359616 [Sordaria brevicollis]
MTVTAAVEGIHLLDHPLPSPPLITLLSQHLPHSLPVLRRFQYADNFPDDGLGVTPYSHCLFASRHAVEECLTSASGDGGKKKEGRKHFAAAFVDLSRFPETQVWVYSTLEDYGVFDPEVGSGSGFGSGFSALAQSHSLPEDEAKECDQLMLALLRRMKTIAFNMPVTLEDVSEQRQENWREAREYLLMNPPPSSTDGTTTTNTNGDTTNGDTTTTNGDNKTARAGPKVMIGSLAEIHRHRLILDKKNGYGVKMHKTSNIPDEIEWEVCQKWLFRTEALVLPSDALQKIMAEEGLVWDSVRTKEDVKLVQSRTAIKRQEDTLLGLPSVSIREKGEKGGGKEGKMVAWGFMALDGTLMTLHVEDAYRGKGLAKAVACKVMRDHLSEYGDDGWGAADVFVDNVRSQGVCKSIGGRVGWLLSWAVVDLGSVGEGL